MCERYCLLPLRGLLAAKQYLDCTYTRPNSSTVADVVVVVVVAAVCRRCSCDTRVVHARVYKVSEKSCRCGVLG